MINLTVRNLVSDYAERVSCTMDKYVIDAYNNAQERRTDGFYSSCSYSLLDVCLMIRGDVYKETTEKVRLIEEKKERQKFKAEYLPTVSFSCYTDTGVDGSRFYTHTGLMSFDFDDVKDILLLKSRLLEDGYFKTLACWTSCSGRGVRWVVPFDVGEYVKEGDDVASVHKRCYMAICDYLDVEYEKYCKVDRSGNLTTFRGLCFLSHDADIYIAPCLLGKDDDEFGSRKRFKFEPLLCDDNEKKKEIECRCGQLSSENVACKFRQAEDNIELLERRGLDITCEYDVWYKMAFALVRTFGDKGRELFHRLSALCVSKYDRLECDKKYDSILTVVLNERNNGISEKGKAQFGTFCHYVKNALGSDFIKERRKYAKKCDLMLDGSEDRKVENNVRKAKKKAKKSVYKSENSERNYNKVKITQKELEKKRLKREVFCWLNDDFERKHLSDAAEMFNLKESTIWNYLKEECKLGHVERVRHGVYVKRFDYAQSA